MGKENKLHVVLVGRRNNGKSSLVNALTGQEVSIVSDTPGTTTDPVRRGYEIPDLAPVVFIDTAGVDDSGPLGDKRAGSTARAIEQADVALLVIAGNRFEAPEERLASDFIARELPFFIVHNKRDEEPLAPGTRERLVARYGVPVVDFSAARDGDTTPLVEALREVGREAAGRPPSLVGDLLGPGDRVLLVVPVDTEAPAGRLILPQVQVLRDVLDHRGVAVVAGPDEVEGILREMATPPRLVVTDSQAFARVAAVVPANVPLTSFSIVLARQKGPFEEYLRGTPRVDTLLEGDRVLVLEACSHHVTGDDIGRHKLPAWIERHAGKSFRFDFVAGRDPVPRPVEEYALVIQCGGCMITARQARARLLPFIRAGIPVSNYGMMIARVTGIFDRVTALFHDRGGEGARGDHILGVNPNPIVKG
ncbi:MAG: [FeFe] hydrogenase H-cluster maturation GTPase HydF [Odoribacteraceae bacterium]|jgi:[FeFe] hydrogenase H-cluster maturation GTPase HydF|nr:[FeFe] hydrogenase H-cluster maturation GTPase HydF [Odoribacteraceae bacterium]